MNLRGEDLARMSLAVAIATLSAWGAALVHEQLVRFQVGPGAKVALVIAGGAIAALVRGRTWRARCAFAPAFLFYSAVLLGDVPVSVES